MLTLELKWNLLILILIFLELIIFILLNRLFSKFIIFIYILFSVVTLQIIYIIHWIVFLILHLLNLRWAKIKEIIRFTILIMLLFIILKRWRVRHILRDKLFVINVSKRNKLYRIFTYSILINEVSAHALNWFKTWLCILNTFFRIFIIV